MLPLKGKVSNVSDKSFNFSTIISNTPTELKATYWKAKDLVEGNEYVLIGNLDNNYLYTVEQHNITEYPSVNIVGTASYIKLTNKDGKDRVNFSVTVNQGGQKVYYQCSYVLRSDKVVVLFKNMADYSLVEVSGSLSLTTYNDKQKLNVFVNSFNLLSKPDSNNKAASSDDFATPANKTPLDVDF